MPTDEFLRTVWAYVVARLGIDPRREDGLTTTEVAVLTFLLVGGAIVIAAIITTAGKNNANNIPQPQAPGAGP
jgi:hypothetical protein